MRCVPLAWLIGSVLGDDGGKRLYCYLANAVGLLLLAHGLLGGQHSRRVVLKAHLLSISAVKLYYISSQARRTNTPSNNQSF